MAFTFKAPMMKEWSITDDKFYAGGNKEYPITDIVFIKNQPSMMPLTNGVMNIQTKDGKIHVLGYARSQNALASEAFAFVKKKIDAKDMVKSGNQYVENKEYRKKCNVCGKIYCFSEADVQNNIRLAKQARNAAGMAVLQSLGGTTLGASSEMNRSDSLSSRVVDYSKCPNCNSSDISDLTEEQFKAEQAKLNGASGSNVSAADELIKFKELMDAGVITQEEFAAKKKQLLGL